MKKNVLTSIVFVLSIWSSALAAIDRIDLKVEGMT